MSACRAVPVGMAAALAAMFVAAPRAASTASTPPARIAVFAALSLGRAEDEAVSHSPDVVAARAVVAQDRAALAVARGTLGPAFVGGYTLAPQGTTNAAGAPVTVSQRLTSVGVQTTVGDVIAYSPLVAAAGATLRSAEADERAAVRAERVKAATLYFDALKARAIADAHNGGVQTALRQKDAAAIRVRAGDAPRLDLVRAQVALAQASSTYEVARVADQNATEALRVETATPDSLAQTAPSDLAPQTERMTPELAVSEARARPELVAAQETAVAAEASARAARRAVFPPLTLGAGYTRGVDSGVVVGGPTLTASVSIPLGGASWGRSLQASAAAAQSRAKALSVTRAVLLEVSAAARNVAAAQRAASASSEARRQAAEELAATQLGYRSGASSSLEVTAASDTFNQAFVNELSALYDEAKARAVLDIELGR